MEAQSSKFKAQNKFQGFKLQLVLERKAALARFSELAKKEMYGYRVATDGDANGENGASNNDDDDESVTTAATKSKSKSKKKTKLVENDDGSTSRSVGATILQVDFQYDLQ